MSNTGEATTTARDQEEQENQTPATEQQASEQRAQADTTATTEQDPPGNKGSFAGQEAGIHHQPGASAEQASDTARTASQPKPDVSDQDYQELLPKLMSHFHNNREELARALGLHRSTVDRWLNGKSRPNNSTVLRMRRIAQERRIE